MPRGRGCGTIGARKEVRDVGDLAPAEGRGSCHWSARVFVTKMWALPIFAM
jgi:hypothetical protein